MCRQAAMSAGPDFGEIGLRLTIPGSYFGTIPERIKKGHDRLVVPFPMCSLVWSHKIKIHSVPLEPAALTWESPDVRRRSLQQ
jgi:hypothetical protein